MTIRTKQVLGVTLLVGLIVLPLSAWYAVSTVRRLLKETEAPALLVKDTIIQRVYDIVQEHPGADPHEGLRTDPGLQTILRATGAYFDQARYVHIVDSNNMVIASHDEQQIGQPLPPKPELSELINGTIVDQLRAMWTTGDYEVREDLQLLDGTRLGAIRIGVTTLLIQKEFEDTVRTPLLWVAGALVAAMVMAMLLAQIIVRPIHVIRSGLARLGRGELDVGVDLPPGTELADLGDSFKAISARLAADRTELAGQRATLESVVDVLEDAVALFDANGTLLFANPAMRAAFAAPDGQIDRLLGVDHPYRIAVEQALALAPPRTDPDLALPPVPEAPHAAQIVQLPDGGERLLQAHAVEDSQGRRVGVLLVARNLAYLSQVQSTLNYSRKLAAISRLSAGIAHEVKNPLNATMIHLELLKLQVTDVPAALEHLGIIAAQVRRLDEVVQGFLKFSRPEELKLQPVSIAQVVSTVMPVIRAEAEKSGIDVRCEFGDSLPPVSGDPTLLEQVFLNLALNACQAMPQGGRLRITAATGAQGQVEAIVEDTGGGIAPEHLARIFDLYFTTRAHGSGIGLSLVYRTIQLLDGEIEVQSTPGHGTTFRLRLPRAWGHVFSRDEPVSTT